MPWHLELQNFAFCAAQGSVALIQLQEEERREGHGAGACLSWAWCIRTSPRLLLLITPTAYQAFLDSIRVSGPSLWSSPAVCSGLRTYRITLNALSSISGNCWIHWGAFCEESHAGGYDLKQIHIKNCRRKWGYLTYRREGQGRTWQFSLSMWNVVIWKKINIFLSSQGTGLGIRQRKTEFCSLYARALKGIVKNFCIGIKLLEFKSVICQLLALEIWVKF